MADLCSTVTLTTPGPSLTFNSTTGDTYALDADQETGLDGAPIRGPVDVSPQTDGGIVFPTFLGPRFVTLQGWFVIRSADPYREVTAYAAALETLEQNLLDALDAIRDIDGTLAWSPAHSLTVRHTGDGNQARFRGKWPAKQFVFGLVAANPVVA
jgi:hypothetical protein